MNAQDITNELEKLNITNNNNELDKQSTLPQHISSEWEIDFDHPLGKGNFSDGVYKARKLDGIINGISIPNGICAVKIIGIKHNKIVQREVKAIDILVQLKKYKCIIKFYGYAFNDDKFYIYMEYLNGFESLTKTIHARVDKRLKNEEILTIAFLLYITLNVIHKNDIIHGDIKCDNILYNEQTGEVKIIDFGLCKNNQTKSSFLGGSYTHMSPESKNGITLAKSDFWSLGCSMIEMGGGDLNVNEDGVPTIPASLDSENKFLVKSFLKKDPFMRAIAGPSYYESYGYYNDVNSIKIESDNLDELESYIEETTNCLSLLNFNHEKHSIPSIPSRIEILRTDEAIPKSCIPPSIKYIKFRSFNQPITPDMVPTTVSTLHLPSYNLPIAPNSIPPLIKTLSITSFNHDLDEFSLPEGLIGLHLGKSFDFNEYGGNLPSSLKILECDYIFKKPLKKNNNIPKNVNLLYLCNYNQPITSKSIPESVLVLRLGSKYTHFESLSKLPKSVESLRFNVDDLNDEKENEILKNTSVEDLYVNGKILRVEEKFAEVKDKKRFIQLFKEEDLIQIEQQI